MSGFGADPVRSGGTWLEVLLEPGDAAGVSECTFDDVQCAGFPRAKDEESSGLFDVHREDGCG